MMKCHFVTKMVIVIFVFLSICFLFQSCSTPSLSNFDKLKSDRESIAEQIKNGDLYVTNSGVIELPNSKSYLSDGGVCVLVEYNTNEFAIYFFEFNGGILGDSKGYLFTLSITDQSLIQKAAQQYVFINIEQIDDNWYSCSSTY